MKQSLLHKQEFDSLDEISKALFEYVQLGQSLRKRISDSRIKANILNKEILSFQKLAFAGDNKWRRAAELFEQWAQVSRQPPRKRGRD